MKHLILLFSILGIISTSSCTQKDQTSEKTSYKTYGSQFDPSDTQEISSLSALMEEQDSVAVTLTATIEKTCAVKGCWMQLKTTEESPLRVTFKDYGFFVPKSGMEGKTTTVKGYCVKQETSVETLRHYAKDAGESEEYIASITQPKLEYNFVASGVIIED